MAKEFLLFGGENCDSYRINFENIISFKINGIDFKDLKNKKIENVNTYELITNTPFLKSARHDVFYFPLPYDYNDFTSFMICYIDKKIYYRLRWRNTYDYRCINQSIEKINEGWKYTYNYHYKSKYFLLSNFELMVKQALGVNNFAGLTEDKIKNMEELYISFEKCLFTNSQYNDFLKDLAKLENLKVLCIDFYDCFLNETKWLKGIAKVCPNLKILDLNGYYDPKIVDYFPNLKRCFMPDCRKLHGKYLKIIENNTSYQKLKLNNIEFFKTLHTEVNSLFNIGHITKQELEQYQEYIHKQEKSATENYYLYDYMSYDDCIDEEEIKYEEIESGTL